MNTLLFPPMNDAEWDQLLIFLDSLGLEISSRTRDSENWTIIFTDVVPPGFQLQIETKIQEIQLGVSWS